MTLHIHYDHECPECGADYIPYDTDVPCPRCGLHEEERFADFVSQAADSACYNADCGGSYMPMAWGCFSLADSTLMFLFQMFDGYTAHGEGQTFDDFAREFIRDSTFEDSEYLRDYMHPLATRVYAEVERQRAKEGEGQG